MLADTRLDIVLEQLARRPDDLSVLFALFWAESQTVLSVVLDQNLRDVDDLVQGCELPLRHCRCQHLAVLLLEV